eukprot:TRINITY_DN25309_c0_g1_i1.p1 TRINITY_DN25309_c0_g1~~TRINITY_DN25309_c0_g1_i1.p1  ORF type:complete len:394 (+),score=6.58 TRINITY_DN25309_c0_g1_i1:41-1183(+)
MACLRLYVSIFRGLMAGILFTLLVVEFWPTERMQITSGSFGEQVSQLHPCDKRPSNFEPHFRGPASNATRVAVLIAGQKFRFAYKDSLRNVPGGLSALVCGSLTNYAVDVYITLALTKGKVWRGTLVEPPYVKGELNETEVKQHYEQQGANRVLFNIVPESKVNDMRAEVEERMFKYFRVKYYGSNSSRDELLKKIGLVGELESTRWIPHSKGFLLRHLVHAFMLHVEQTLPYEYSHVLMIREDTAFWWDPSRHDSVATLAQGIFPASVAVDKFCGWGSYNDKIYLAGRVAADALFARSLDELAHSMFRWLATGNSKRARHFQTEYFYRTVLENASISVAKLDFHRTDVRYVDAQQKACIPKIYKRCTSIPPAVFAPCKK